MQIIEFYNLNLIFVFTNNIFIQYYCFLYKISSTKNRNNPAQECGVAAWSAAPTCWSWWAGR